MLKRIFVAVAIVFLSASTAAAADENDYRMISPYLRGAFLEADDDLIHAYSYYMYARRFDRDNIWIELRLAHITYDLGDLKKARGYATRVAESGRYVADAELILAEIDYREGKREAVLERLDSLMSRDGVSKPEILKFRARVLIELERIEEARASLEEARELDPGDADIYYRLGFIYTDAGNLDKGIASFQTATELAPEFADGHLALASVLQAAGRDEEAKESLKKAFYADPYNITAMNELVAMLYDSGEFAEGIEILEPLKAEGNLSEAGLITLGRFYYRDGRTQEALDIFMAMLKEEGEKPSLLRVVGEILMEQGNLKTSYGYYERLIKLEPENFANYVGPLLIAGGFAGEASNPEEEIEVGEDDMALLLEKAKSRLNPESASDNYLIGTIYRRSKEYEKAENYLIEAEKLDPGDRRILIEVATLYELQGQFDEALRRIVFLYEREPEDASLINFYGYLLAEKGEKLDFAEELLNTALEMEPENGYFLDSLGWIKYKKGDYSAALEILKDALSKSGDDPVIWEHLAETYIKLDMPDEALEAYRKSLDLDPDNEAVRSRAKQLETSGLEK
jgi:tetratricopeptide (TPR) repeat protein